jgi:uracil-DNA glycosylase
MYNKQFWVTEFGEDWAIFLKELLKSPYMEKLMNFLSVQYSFNEVYPSEKKLIFKTFKNCPLKDLRIIIVSDTPQFNSSIAGGPYADCFIDGYHNGSLRVIGECVQREFGLNLEFDYSLEPWEKQGILLLNKTMTTKLDDAFAHTRPWNQFFEKTLEILVKERTGLIFLVWGNTVFKEKFVSLIGDNHHIFSWEHPHEALYENRPWHCPNFKQVNTLLNHLHGETGKINW